MECAGPLLTVRCGFGADRCDPPTVWRSRGAARRLTPGTHTPGRGCVAARYACDNGQRNSINPAAVLQSGISPRHQIPPGIRPGSTDGGVSTNSLQTPYFAANAPRWRSSMEYNPVEAVMNSVRRSIPPKQTFAVQASGTSMVSRSLPFLSNTTTPLLVV